MLVVTRSKARLGQSTGLVASSRDDVRSRPKKVIESQQGNALLA